MRDQVLDASGRNKILSLSAFTEGTSHLLATYATDDVIAETVSDIYSFTQGPNNAAELYSDALWTKVLWCALP